MGSCDRKCCYVIFCKKKTIQCSGWLTLTTFVELNLLSMKLRFKTTSWSEYWIFFLIWIGERTQRTPSVNQGEKFLKCQTWTWEIFQDSLQEVVLNLNFILSKFSSTKLVRVNHPNVHVLLHLLGSGSYLFPAVELYLYLARSLHQDQRQSSQISQGLRRCGQDGGLNLYKAKVSVNLLSTTLRSGEGFLYYGHICVVGHVFMCILFLKYRVTRT